MFGRIHEDGMTVEQWFTEQHTIWCFRATDHQNHTFYGNVPVEGGMYVAHDAEVAAQWLMEDPKKEVWLVAVACKQVFRTWEHEGYPWTEDTETGEEGDEQTLYRLGQFDRQRLLAQGYDMILMGGEYGDEKFATFGLVLDPGPHNVKFVKVVEGFDGYRD